MVQGAGLEAGICRDVVRWHLTRTSIVFQCRIDVGKRHRWRRGPARHGVIANSYQPNVCAFAVVVIPRRDPRIVGGHVEIPVVRPRCLKGVAVKLLGPIDILVVDPRAEGGAGDRQRLSMDFDLRVFPRQTLAFLRQNDERNKRSKWIETAALLQRI